MSTDADPARPHLTPAQFQAAVHRHVPNPDLPAEAAALQEQLHRCLAGVADLAARLASPCPIHGQRLSRLFTPLGRDVRDLYAKANGLQTRLYMARKAAGLAPRVQADPPGNSATLALACWANRVIVAANEIVDALAWVAWEEKVAKEAEENGWNDNPNEPEEDMAFGATADDADRAPTLDVEEVSSPFKELDYPAALASAAAAAKLHDRFAGANYPDPGRLLEEAGLELIELDGPASPKGEAAAAPAKPKPRKNCRRADRKPARLTQPQTEALLLLSGHKGNVAAAAKAAGITRQVMSRRVEAAQKKLGKAGVPKPRTKRIPTDGRGQPNI